MPLSAIFPLVLTVLLLVTWIRRHMLWLLPLAALPALAVVFLVPFEAEITLSHTLMASTWKMDAQGQIFQFLTAVVWLAAGCFSVPYFKDHPRKGAYVIPFLLAMSGNFLLTTAADAVTFYTGFGLMSFASWGLVVHAGTPEAVRAGRVYLALVVLGELIVFPGLVKGVLWAESGLLSEMRAHWALDPNPGLQLSLIFFGFALKAGLFPLHFWLPLAHPAAPTPASAVLSGCMIKAGLLAWLRLLPLGELSMPALAHVVTVLAGAGMIVSLLIALTQTHPKALLAYSSVSKMSAIMLMLSPSLLDPDHRTISMAAIFMYTGFHALHKCALFLGVAVTPRLGRAGWIPLVGLAASFAAFPGLPGAMAKTPLKFMLNVLPPFQANLYALLFQASTVLTVLVMARFVWLTRPGSAPRSNPVFSISVWLGTVVAALWTSFHFYERLQLSFLKDTASAWWFFKEDPAFWVGVVLVAVAVVLKAKPPIHIPPGDILNVWPKMPTPARSRGERFLLNTELRLNGAAGGLAFLAITLFILALLWRVAFFPVT